MANTRILFVIPSIEHPRYHLMVKLYDALVSHRLTKLHHIDFLLATPDIPQLLPESNDQKDLNNSKISSIDTTKELTGEQITLNNGSHYPLEKLEQLKNNIDQVIFVDSYDQLNSIEAKNTLDIITNFLAFPNKTQRLPVIYLVDRLENYTIRSGLNQNSFTKIFYQAGEAVKATEEVSQQEGKTTADKGVEVTAGLFQQVKISGLPTALLTAIIELKRSSQQNSIPTFINSKNSQLFSKIFPNNEIFIPDHYTKLTPWQKISPYKLRNMQSWIEDWEKKGPEACIGLILESAESAGKRLLTNYKNVLEFILSLSNPEALLTTLYMSEKKNYQKLSWMLLRAALSGTLEHQTSATFLTKLPGPCVENFFKHGRKKFTDFCAEPLPFNMQHLVMFLTKAGKVLELLDEIYKEIANCGVFKEPKKDFLEPLLIEAISRRAGNLLQQLITFVPKHLPNEAHFILDCIIEKNEVQISDLLFFFSLSKDPKNSFKPAFHFVTCPKTEQFLLRVLKGMLEEPENETAHQLMDLFLCEYTTQASYDKPRDNTYLGYFFEKFDQNNMLQGKMDLFLNGRAKTILEGYIKSKCTLNGLERYTNLMTACNIEMPRDAFIGALLKHGQINAQRCKKDKKILNNSDLHQAIKKALEKFEIKFDPENNSPGSEKLAHYAAALKAYEQSQKTMQANKADIKSSYLGAPGMR